MSLAIEISQLNGRIFYHLTDENANYGLKRLFDSSHFESIRRSNWFHQLKEHDDKSILDNLTNDQLMVAIAFYLNDYISSKEIMIRWFQDSGLNQDVSIILTNIVYSAGISKDNILNELVLPDLTNHNHIDLNHILESLKERGALQFAFETISSSDNKTSEIYDISKIPETNFLIEDHNCIVVGFSVNCTSFIEILSGYRAYFLDSLCNLIPLKQRDNISVARFIDIQKDVMKMILLKSFREIESYGLDKNGKLMKLLRFPNVNERQEHIPLYFKLIK